MTPRTRLAWITAAVALAAYGCASVPLQDTAQSLSPDVVPPDLVATAPPTTASPATTESATSTYPARVWFVRTDRIVPTTRALATPPAIDGLVAALLDGPTETETASLGLRTALPGPEVLQGVSVAGGVATVDLAAAFSELPPTEQLLSIAQLVTTLTSFPGVGQVSFRLEGEQISVPRGDGTLDANPVTADAYGGLQG